MGMTNFDAVTAATINASTALQIGGTAVTATADELNALDGSSGAGPFASTTRIDLFDDFFQTATTTEESWDANWLTFDGGGTSAAAAAIVAAPEGKVDLVSGTAGTAGVADAACMSGVSLTGKGALVSLGTMILEARVSVSHITGATVCVGLSNLIVDDAKEAVLHHILVADIVDDGLSVTDAVSFTQDSEATGATKWHGVSENGGTIAHVAAAGECILASGPTADTYQILRLEVDATGDARFYVDGTLEFTETTAVATTAVLVPYFAVTAEDGTPVSTTLSMDYAYFSHVRNPSNA
jgi:hypothetical protein